MLKNDLLEKECVLKEMKIKKNEWKDMMFEIEDRRLKKALLKSFLPGRCQRLRKNNVVFYLDGAHTIESLEVEVYVLFNGIRVVRSGCYKKSSS